jgi:hypothetical protein
MPDFLLIHHHTARDCAAACAAWKGFDSPLRGRPAMSTCLTGSHVVWWRVQAADRRAALQLLPSFVAQRTNPIEFREVQTP